MQRKRKSKTPDLGFTPSRYQQAIFDWIMHGVGNAVVVARAGSGKCLGKDTEVLMYDGRPRRVQDIKIGDVLMGDDSTPRVVLSTTIGHGPLVRIIPLRGESWICNDVHILTLVKDSAADVLIDMSVDDLLRSGSVDADSGNVTGYSLIRTAVSYPDSPQNADVGGLMQISSLWNSVTGIDNDGLYGSWDTRLLLLKDIVTRCGDLRDGKLSVANRRICNSIVVLANSLGVEAYCQKNAHSFSVYFPNGMPSNVTWPCNEFSRYSVPFKIQRISDGDYYGFTLSGNGRFLLSDFTITHNTTTAVAAMKHIPSRRTCLFIAFNKVIAESLEQKLQGFDNCKAMTMHSLGFAMLRNFVPARLSLDQYKYRTFLKSNLMLLSSAQGDCVRGDKAKSYVEAIDNLVNLSRLHLSQTVDDIRKVAIKYGITVMSDECQVALKCMEWGSNHLDTIDYTDMVWLPVALDVPPIGQQYDWVFLDEAQDVSQAVLHLFQKCLKRGSRFVAVGDDKQSINLFAGCDSANFHELSKGPNVTIFPLPISYRCDNAIIDLARKYVPDIEPRPEAGIGKIIKEVSWRDLRDSDLVLGRTTASLMGIYTKCLSEGRKCWFKGSSVKDEFVQTLDSIKETTLSASLKEDGVFPRLYLKMFESRDYIMDSLGLDYDDATMSDSIQHQLDIIKSLEILSDDCVSKSQLLNKIDAIFTNNQEGICFSTIHKAKGMEADSVYIMHNSTLPAVRKNTQPWLREQEVNLVYVAYTRAKHNLGFISEVEFPPVAMRVGINENEQLRLIENRVCRLAGLEPRVLVENADLARFQLQDVTVVPSPVEFEGRATPVLDVPHNPSSPSDLLSELESWLG